MKLHRLNALRVAREVDPGYFADGGGLHLQISQIGSRACSSGGASCAGVQPGGKLPRADVAGVCPATLATTARKPRTALAKCLRAPYTAFEAPSHKDFRNPSLASRTSTHVRDATS